MIRFVFFLLFAALSQAVQAEGSVPKVGEAWVRSSYPGGCAATPLSSSTCARPEPIAAEIAAWEVANAKPPGWNKNCIDNPSAGCSKVVNHVITSTPGQSPATGSYTLCVWPVGNSGWSPCTPGLSFSASRVATGACPSNSTASGFVCNCASGKVPNVTGDACVTPPQTCAQDCGKCIANHETMSSLVGGGMDEIPESGGTGVSTVCFEGCKMRYGFRVKGLDGGWYGSMRSATGELCNFSGDAAPLPEPEVNDSSGRCPEGQAPGTINGVTVCVPARESVSSPGSAASGSTAAETVETRCSNGLCETITRIGDTVTKREFETVGSYCGRFPMMAHCSGRTNSGGGGGALGSGGSGTGLNTEGGSGGGGEGEGEGNVCEENPEAAGCKPLGTAPGEGMVGSHSIGLNITPLSGFGPSTAACPPPRTVSVAGMTLSMPFDLLCQFADGIRPIVVGLAWISAVLGFVGLSRKD